MLKCAHGRTAMSSGLCLLSAATHQVSLHRRGLHRVFQVHHQPRRHTALGHGKAHRLADLSACFSRASRLCAFSCQAHHTHALEMLHRVGDGAGPCVVARAGRHSPNKQLQGRLAVSAPLQQDCRAIQGLHGRRELLLTLQCCR